MKKIRLRKSPNIVAAAQVINGAYLDKYLVPQLVKEYQNDREDFLALLPKVPKTAVGKEGIYKNRLMPNVEGVINNAVDFGAPVANDKKNLFVPWDTVDTKPTSTSRSELRAMTYDLEAVQRVRHMKTLKRLTRDYLVHKIAPNSHTADNPVVQLAAGMKYEEIIKIGTILKNMDMNLDDFMIIFCPEHTQDLGISQGAGTAFRPITYNEKTGKANPFGGFKNIFEHNKMPMYTDAFVKKAFQAATVGTDKPSTLIVNINETVFHREGVSVHATDKRTDTRSADPKSEFRLGGFFVADVLINKGFVALV